MRTFQLIQKAEADDFIQELQKADAEGYTVVNFAVGDNYFYALIAKEIVVELQDRNLTLTAENA